MSFLQKSTDVLFPSFNCKTTATGMMLNKHQNFIAVTFKHCEKSWLSVAIFDELLAYVNPTEFQTEDKLPVFASCILFSPLII